MPEEASLEDAKKQADLRFSMSTESPSRLPISASLSTSVGYRLSSHDQGLVGSNMVNSDGTRGAVVRFVRCPGCYGVLPELAGASVYKCGGCGTTVRGKAGLDKRFHPGAPKSQELSDQHSLKDFSAVGDGGESFWQLSDGTSDMPSSLSDILKDSFKYPDSFTRWVSKELNEVDDSKLGQDPLHAAHAAATRIQKQFRGWKKTKEFLLIRQRIVKIQALVRGHQVRKHYAKKVFSVQKGEKVTSLTRRTSFLGLRRVRSEGEADDTSGWRNSIFMDKDCGDPVPYRERLWEEERQTAVAPRQPCYKLPPPVALRQPLFARPAHTSQHRQSPPSHQPSNLHAPPAEPAALPTSAQQASKRAAPDNPPLVSAGSLYKVLGVGQDCSDDELGTAYRKLAIRWHPDRYSGAGSSTSALEAAKAKLQKIHEAYTILSDPDKRIVYDMVTYDSDGDDDKSGKLKSLEDLQRMLDEICLKSSPSSCSPDDAAGEVRASAHGGQETGRKKVVAAGHGKRREWRPVEQDVLTMGSSGAEQKPAVTSDT